MWQPEISQRKGPRYTAIADALADDINQGDLEPGAKLPPQRDLAYALGLNIGTVTRAYAEAERRGLVSGEVGRGTFVRGTPGEQFRMGNALFRDGERSNLINLSLNYPNIPAIDAIAEEAFRASVRDGDFSVSMNYQDSRGRREDREASTIWFDKVGLEDCDPERVIITCGNMHATFVALSCITRPGDVVLTEALTWPGIKSVAATLGLRLVGVTTDEQGMLPDALEAACRAHSPKALYTITTLQNPTTSTMPPERREQIAAILRSNNLQFVEDGIYSFLPESPPTALVSYAPELGWLATGPSKVGLPGMRIGYLHLPDRRHTDIALTAMRGTTWMAPPLMSGAVSDWLQNGVMDQLIHLQREECRSRVKTVADALFGLYFQYQPTCPHIWLELPEPWRVNDFVQACQRNGVAVSGAEHFIVGRGHAPHAVRICIGAPETAGELLEGVKTVHRLARSVPDRFSAVV